MKNYRSFSIPIRDIEAYDLQTAKERHKKRLKEISLLHSDRIDNISPVNYTECRKVGKKFRYNRKYYLESLISRQKDNVKIFLRLYHISHYNINKSLNSSNFAFHKSPRKDKKLHDVDNSMILKKLTTVKSSLKLDLYKEDFKNHLEYVRLGQRLRLPKIKNT